MWISLFWFPARTIVCNAATGRAVQQKKERKRKMKQTVTEIGVLEYSQNEYGGYFKGKKPIKLFSENYEIDICFDVFQNGTEGLTNEMIKATKACLDAINNQTDKLEQAIKRYYDTEVREDAEGRGDDYMEIEDANQLARIVTPKELYIQDLKTEIVIGLYFICEWDEEGGMGVMFDTEGNICEVGTGEIIY